MERNDSLRVFTKNGGFVMNNGKLQEVKWLRTEFKYDHEEDENLFYKAYTTYQKPDGTTDVLYDYDIAFDSIGDYEKNVSAATSYKKLSSAKSGGDVINDIIRGVKRTISPEYWVFDTVHNTPVRYELELEAFYFDYTDRRFHTDEFPEGYNIYDTKERALSYNTYKVVNEDGSEYEREGINKLISLDDDQRELVKQFEDICKKMRESNMVLIADYDSLAVFNMRKAFKVNSNIEWWSDENNLFIIRKPTEDTQKKTC